MKYFTINNYLSTCYSIFHPILLHINDVKNDSKFINEYINNHTKEYNNIHKLSPQSKPGELVDFYKLCIKLRSVLKSKELRHQDVSGFFLNTKLNNGIITDFDVLRFSHENILNIELKHLKKKDFNKQQKKLINKFKTQDHIFKIIRNRDNKIESFKHNYNRKIYNIVYFAKNNDFMIFDPTQNCLKDYNINLLVDILTSSTSIDKNEILSLEPSDYIISPSKDFHQYINGEYLLTSYQQNAVDYIMNNVGIYGIYGCAGSGKSLVAYDIIRKLPKYTKILFIFCGYTENVHRIMNNHFKNADFIQIKDLDSSLLSSYNYIFVDEAQKIYPDSLNTLLTFIKTNHKSTTVCFLYDLDQTLEKKDRGAKLNTFLKERGKRFKLGGPHRSSIRSNKDINEFIKAVKDKSNDISEISINDLDKHIDVKYFDNVIDSCPYILHLMSNGYKFITPTPNTFEYFNVDKFEKYLPIDNSNNSHNNIGEEYNKVVTYADENLGYNHGDNHIKIQHKVYHNLVHELYVNMSRAISKLSLLIIGNKSLYKQILKIIYRNRDINRKMMLWYLGLRESDQERVVNYVTYKLKERRINNKNHENDK